MKRSAFLLLTLLCSFMPGAQELNVPQLLNKLRTPENDSVVINQFNLLCDKYELVSPDSNLYYATKALEIGKETHNEMLIAISYAECGYALATAGNTPLGLEMAYKGLHLAEPIQNKRALSIINNALGVIHSFCNTQEMNERAEQYYKQSKSQASDVHATKELGWALGNLGAMFIREKKYDSALIVLQQQDLLAKRYNDNVWLANTYTSIGNIYIKQGRTGLGLEYYRLAEADAARRNSGRLMARTAMNFASYFFDENIDSSMYYARKALSCNPLLYDRKNICLLLSKLYARTSVYDSAYNYAEMYTMLSDSLLNIGNTQKTQALSLGEELRQKELAADKEKAHKEHLHNLQYILICVGVLTLIVILILLTRSLIVNEKVIGFLSVLILLIFFEFINLLIHPYLGELTHHTPLTMLLIMVFIASILVPVHHKLEHLVKHSLTEKNKKIRFHKAKKIIERLEGVSEMN